MSMLREDSTHNGLHAFRTCGPDADHALLILHGTGAHGGCYEGFTSHHAGAGVDIYSLSLPGHGRSRGTRGDWTMQACIDATDEFARHIKATTGLPVFVLGSSQGSGMALYALDQSEVLQGAITLCLAAFSLSPFKERFSFLKDPALQSAYEVFGSSLTIDIAKFMDLDANYGNPELVETLFADPDMIWHYPLRSWASMATYEPPRPLSDNVKPVLVTVGEEDPIMPPRLVERLAAQVGGPVRFEVVAGAPHQVMLERTETFSTLVADWVREQI